MASGLLCIGLTTVDIVARPIDRTDRIDRVVLIDGIEMAPAGTAAGTALVAAALGVDTALVGAVGADLKGRFVRMALDEGGVDTRLLATLAGRATSATLLGVTGGGGRLMFHALGAGHWANVTSEAIERAATARFVHWGGVGGVNLNGGPGEGLLRAAKAGGAVVTCDLIGPGPDALDELKRLLPHVDYFMPSAAEALALAGTDDLATAAGFFLALGAGSCVIKTGAEGSYLAQNERRIAIPAHAITPIDTTSCGDSYCAGFIAALDRDWPVAQACRFATATASLVAQGLGTLGRLENFDATEQAMHAMPLRNSV